MRHALRALTFSILGASLAAVAVAGGEFEVLRVTGPGPTPGVLAGELAPMHWDVRCVPVQYTLNTFALPNARPPLDAAGTRAVLQRALDRWNDISTSYIEMRITGERQRPRNGPFDLVVLDFVNEINFLGVTADGGAAGSSATVMAIDNELVAGTDLDRDGDIDVFDPVALGIHSCADVDGDGDIEFPAGFYAAGTIIDNDITFNNDRFTWTTGPPDADPLSLDLEASMAHESGHGLGLSHSLVNQISADDGTGATMDATQQTADPDEFLAFRSLEADDVAWASFLYPEGSAADGVAALGPGDVAFDAVYGVIRGEVTHGRTGRPLVGGSIYAVDRASGEVVTSHFTGEARVFFDLGTGMSFFDPSLPDYHLAAGSYTLPVPAGEYHLAIEAMDGSPVAAADFMRFSVALAGDLFGLLDFNEEFLLEKETEHEPLEVEVEAGEETVVDHRTHVDFELDPFDLVGGAFDPADAVFFEAPPGLIYAVRVPAAEMIAHLDAGEPRAMAFFMGVFDRSVAPVFPRAALATGRTEGELAFLDLDRPLVEVVDFLGQDRDFAPLFFDEPADVAEHLREAIEDGASDVFMVLELPQVFAGFHGLPPLIGLDIGQQAGLLGRSYLSVDGGASFFRVPFVNIMFRMIFRAAA